MRSLEVDLGPRSYPIWIGEGLIAQAGERLRERLMSPKIMIVTNPVVAGHYLGALRQSLEGAGFVVSQVVLPDGEAYKTLETWQLIFDGLLADKHGRDTTVVALGGGVIGDMAGFAAACYQRGVDFVQVPTTLLSQVDSSVGGKTGVNHPAGKNMIGAFYQPKAVLIDVTVLNTLPVREFSAGLAEVIKYGLIGDAAFLAWLEEHIDRLMARESAVLIEAVARSCENKARIVGLDEREQGIRATLNLGHTFGHAIEASQGYGQWLHGEAVAAGMVMAAKLSAQLGWLAGQELPRLVRLLKAAGLPIAPPAGMAAAEFLKYMAVDKKVQQGRIRLILLKGIGEAVVTDAVTAEQIQTFLEA
jgi:3-dehydroquinate synthase